MTEIQQIGKRHVVYELEAKILPERLLLEDLIHCNHASIIAIDKEEFELLKKEMLADHSID